MFQRRIGIGRTRPLRETILTLLNSGLWSMEEIACGYRVNPETIQAVLDGTQERVHLPPPERNAAAKAKLTEDDVREARRLYEAGGVTYQKLGERFGVHYTAIMRAVKRTNWKRID